MNDTILTLNDANFEEMILKAALPALVDLWPRCAPCKMIAPVVEELASEYNGRLSWGNSMLMRIPELPVVMA